MDIVQCHRCRHTFLNSAKHCPECSTKIPWDVQQWLPLAAVALSALAITATTLMARSIQQGEQDDLKLRKPAVTAATTKAGQLRPPTLAHAGAQN